MFGFLRRHQPGNPLLAVLYWAVLTLVAFALLLVIFFQIDRFLPAMY